MIVRVHPLGEVPDSDLAFAVIVSYQGERLVLVRHEARTTWEVPGGHREVGESIDGAAHRELREETGAADYRLAAVCDYSVQKASRLSHGRLFRAEITAFGPLPASEIAEVRLFTDLPSELTYPAIQPILLAEVQAARAVASE